MRSEHDVTTAESRSMTQGQASTTITTAGRGVQVELGELYNARTSELFPGVSLWKSDARKGESTIVVEGGSGNEFFYYKSLEELRAGSKLSAEASLELDVGLFQVKGSAEVLRDSRTSMNEARVQVVCRVLTQTRKLEMDRVVDVAYDELLDDERFTHYVACVEEGGLATLTFSQKCTSKEEALSVAGKLEGKLCGIVELALRGSVSINNFDSSAQESIEVSMKGTYVEAVTTLRDALEVIQGLPDKLRTQKCTLSFVLNPVCILDSKARRLVRALDARVMRDTKDALAKGRQLLLELKDLENTNIHERFPQIYAQIRNFVDRLSAFEEQFSQFVRNTLPKLKDGNMQDDHYTEHANALSGAVCFFQIRAGIAELFIREKRVEIPLLERTVGKLMDKGMQDRIGTPLPDLLASDLQKPRLTLSFGGENITSSHHRLLRSLTADTPIAIEDDDFDDSGDETNNNRAWFHDETTRDRLSAALGELDAVMTTNAENPNRASYVVGLIERAKRFGGTKERRTKIGDIIYEARLPGAASRRIVVNNHLPTIPPSAPKLEVKGSQTIEATWTYEANEVFAVSRFHVCYRPLPLLKDGRAWFMNDRIEEAGTKQLFIEGPFNDDLPAPPVALLEGLLDGVTYEVSVFAELEGGLFSPTSAASQVATDTTPSEASSLICFFKGNQDRLSQETKGGWLRCGGRKPWDLDRGSLFLGWTTREIRRVPSGSVGVVVVDVAPQYRPEVPFPDSLDESVVVVMAGATGHGKSTENNTLVSYLLGGELDDEVRLMLVDDRGKDQALSVTSFVTVYRLRPLTGRFRGKNVLLVDPPGFNDSDGHSGDMRVRACMGELLQVIKHVNAIFLCVKENEIRKDYLTPAVNYVFQLLATDVRDCLRTIVTMATVVEPKCLLTLSQIGWPTDKYIKVENSAFRVDRDTKDLQSADERDVLINFWNLSMRGQRRVLDMLLGNEVLPGMEPVPTKKSLQVTTCRIELDQRCDVYMKKILKLANNIVQLTNLLKSIATAVTSPPNATIEHKWTDFEQIDASPGQNTTFCKKCRYTCHENCSIAKDEDKAHCWAMTKGKCRICPNKCDWQDHTNASFIVVPVEKRKWVVPGELLTAFNETTTTFEKTVLEAIGKYKTYHNELQTDIIDIASITCTIKQDAIKHDPDKFVKHLEAMIGRARDHNATSEQLRILIDAKNAMKLAAQVNKHYENVAYLTAEQQVLASVFKKVEAELNRRIALSPDAYAEETKKSCSLYNTLLKEVPRDLRNIMPRPLRQKRYVTSGALYKENLAAIVNLVEVLLKSNVVMNVD